MSEPQATVSRIEQPIHLTVTRNAKGRYQWELSLHTPTADEALVMAYKMDDELKTRYKGQIAGEEGGEK